MSETRLVSIVFEGQEVPGIQGEVTNESGTWKVTGNHVDRSQSIHDAIRQLPGVHIPPSSYIRLKPGSITGESVEYEEYTTKHETNNIQRRENAKRAKFAANKAAYKLRKIGGKRLSRKSKKSKRYTIKSRK